MEDVLYPGVAIRHDPNVRRMRFIEPHCNDFCELCEKDQRDGKVKVPNGCLEKRYDHYHLLTQGGGFGWFNRPSHCRSCAKTICKDPKHRTVLPVRGSEHPAVWCRDCCKNYEDELEVTAGIPTAVKECS